jgi:hypothetical protein
LGREDGYDGLPLRAGSVSTSTGVHCGL